MLDVPFDELEKIVVGWIVAKRKESGWYRGEHHVIGSTMNGQTP